MGPTKVAITDPDTLSDHQYPQAYRQFLSETTGHEMHVLHDDGVYRHLRFKAPDTMMWHFDIITWPGHLTLVGDIGRPVIFSRTEDMLSFFDHGQPLGHINASYWAQKILDGPSQVRVFSPEAFLADVHERATNLAEYLNLSQDEIARLYAEIDVMNFDSIDDPREAYDALTSFTFSGEQMNDDVNPSAWETYEHHFPITLHAILWGAKVYHATKAAAA